MHLKRTDSVTTVAKDNIQVMDDVNQANIDPKIVFIVPYRNRANNLNVPCDDGYAGRLRS